MKKKDYNIELKRGDLILGPQSSWYNQLVVAQLEIKAVVAYAWRHKRQPVFIERANSSDMFVVR